MSRTNAVDVPTSHIEAEALRRHAEGLRREADAMTGPVAQLVATSYRRRAAELELAAWALDVRAGIAEVTAA